MSAIDVDGAGQGVTGAGAGRRPNVLWICTDQQRFDTLGCHGNPWTATPNLDALSGSGVSFEQAYAQSPVCTPSRASFLTGRYPRTAGARQNGQSIPPTERLLPRILADHGYVCGLAGKLHVSSAHPSVHPAGEPRIDDGYAEFHWSHHPSPDWPTNEYSHWLHERGERYEAPFLEGSRYVQRGMAPELHQTTWCAQKAVDFIAAGADFDAPWMFSLNIFAPHHPFDPPPEHLARYLDRLDEIELPAYVDGELDDKPVYQRSDHEGRVGNARNYPFTAMDERDHRLLRAAYWAMCDHVDEEVGRLLAALEESGQTEDTIVVFSSDHGEMLGDHGIYLKGPYFYQQLLHVPLVISWPGTVPAARVGSLVELVDVVPTLLEAAGLPPEPGVQGRSLWSGLLGGEATAREDVYAECYNAMAWHTDPKPEATMVRTPTHKLVSYHGTGAGELYDLAADPGEHVNLWSDPAQAATRADLVGRLADRMAWTVDPLPEREANF